MSLVLDFTAIDATMLAEVGGKAANLGELSRAGFPVPQGFCVTTDAYRMVADTTDLAALTPEKARETLLATDIPDEVRDAVTAEYRALGDDVPVAVRSSATAEDLPFASFAGQQDTYLNVVGTDAVLDAVRRCWSSLWTDRAVAYRTTNGIDHRAVHLAVVVQRMVDSAIAGVLFTANPVTGRRRQAVIDASPGLGEAVVSGAVNPDHFVVETATGEIVERRLGDKRLVIRSLPGGGTEHVEQADDERACLSDEQLRNLAALGDRVETHYGSPQDTEWAIDAAGGLWLTQARPITTLYPLPANASADDLRVYFCFSLAQGLERPITPSGRATFRMLAGSAANLLGLERPTVYGEAGERLFFDFTGVLRSRTGRQLVPRVLDVMEARSAQVLRGLFDEPRLSVLQESRWPFARRLLRIAARYHVPVTAMRALVAPDRARQRLDRLGKELNQRISSADGHPLDDAERMLRGELMHLVPKLAPTVLVGFAMLGLTGKIVRTEPGELQTILRGLPHNVTTEMDLSLWHLSAEIRRDSAAAQAFHDNSVAELVQRYQAGELPAVVQRGFARFLAQYGHRAVAEIDLGLPRWSDDPTHVIGVVANYLRLDDDALSPDAMFARGAAEAEAMVERLATRARGRGWLVRWALRRSRLLAGMRELPKYLMVCVLGEARKRVAEVGAELVRDGRLDARDDVFFLDFNEMRSPDGDLRALVAERRETYDREMRRRHIPRVLLSDGTEPEARSAPVAPGALAGTPASAGSVTGPARVVMDPVGAHLEPGEILVAPSTDPGWTPLFLTAGGLVMEMGGANSHGAVVAREYGIPAVVGVRDAVSRITTGQLITVDGAAGTITIADD